MDPAPVWSDMRTFDARRWRGCVDLVVGGYPCFEAGTYICARQGHVPIEQLRVGDEVLTHLGRWRRVTAVMCKPDAELRYVRGGIVSGTFTTDEHPYFVRQQGRKWNNARRQYDRTFGDPQWLAASELRGSGGPRGGFPYVVGRHYLGSILPATDDRATADVAERSFWWLVGRWLADGWCQSAPSQHGKKRVVLCAGKHERGEIEPHLAAAGFGKSYTHDERTTVRYNITRASFYDFLQQFGKGAAGKRIPGHVLSLDQDRARALVDGYLSGDGCRTAAGWTAATVSKGLALGIAALAQRAYGVVPSIDFVRPAPTTVIEGRTVRQRPQWVVRIPNSNRSAIVDGDRSWFLCKRSEPADRRAPVYNISVADDESYVADGAIVHNCTSFSHAGRRRGHDDDANLWPEVVRVVRECEPAAVFCENVAAHTTLGLQRVVEEMASLGYAVQTCIARASDVGAPHKRERIFWLGVAHPCDGGCSTGEQHVREGQPDAAGCGAAVAHANSDGFAIGSESGLRLRQPGHDADGRDADVADTGRTGEQRRGGSNDVASAPGSTASQGGERERGGCAAGDRVEGMAHAASDRRGEGRPVGEGQFRQLALAVDGGVGNPDGEREREPDTHGTGERDGRQGPRSTPLGASKLVGDSDGSRLEGRGSAARDTDERDAGEAGAPFPPGPDDRDGWRAYLERWPGTEPAVRRGAHGIPARVDRLRALGNAVVSAQAELAFRLLAFGPGEEIP